MVNYNTMLQEIRKIAGKTLLKFQYEGNKLIIRSNKDFFKASNSKVNPSFEISIFLNDDYKIINFESFYNSNYCENESSISSFCDILNYLKLLTPNFFEQCIYCENELIKKYLNNKFNEIKKTNFSDKYIFKSKLKVNEILNYSSTETNRNNKDNVCEDLIVVNYEVDINEDYLKHEKIIQILKFFSNYSYYNSQSSYYYSKSSSETNIKRKLYHYPLSNFVNRFFISDNFSGEINKDEIKKITDKYGYEIINNYGISYILETYYSHETQILVKKLGIDRILVLKLSLYLLFKIDKNINLKISSLNFWIDYYFLVMGKFFRTDFLTAWEIENEYIKKHNVKIENVAKTAYLNLHIINTFLEEEFQIENLELALEDYLEVNSELFQFNISKVYTTFMCFKKK